MWGWEERSKKALLTLGTIGDCGDFGVFVLHASFSEDTVHTEGDCRFVVGGEIHVPKVQMLYLQWALDLFSLSLRSQNKQSMCLHDLFATVSTGKPRPSNQLYSVII